jgi:carbon starvation protein
VNVLTFLIPALALYVVAQRYYAPFLGRVFGADDARPTPAVTHNDGVDYVPTRPHVLFAHHFSAIAAAGPILGPTLALLYGYVPAFIWIVVGAILIGAVHDYACLFVSMREDGRSIAEIARKTLGTPAFVLFALFIIFNLVVVNAVFINLTATSLTSLQAPSKLGLDTDQTIFRTVPGPDGQPLAVVGGIASTSAIVLTIVAPLLGFLLAKRNLRERYAYPIATALCVGSVLAGFAMPVAPPSVDLGFMTIAPVDVWIILIAVYVWLAAAVPVWLVLQPREFVSVQFLYLGILLLVAAVVGAGIQGQTIQAPAFAFAQGQGQLGFLWPSLFITIACGAISGFHGLVSSGTTAKQIRRESDAKNIGYLAMIGESALALCVALAIATGVSYSEYTSYLIKPFDAPETWRQNPVLAFSVGVAGICDVGLGIPKWLGLVFGLLMVEGFVLDTLDVSIRLNRYLLEEVWAVAFRKVPKFLKNFWVNSGISVALMLGLAYGNTANNLWPIFGSGNQLLASLSLVTLSVWFLKRKRRVAFVLGPAIFVAITTIASLVYLLYAKYLPGGKTLLAVTDVIFLVLAAGIFALAARAARQALRESREA